MRICFQPRIGPCNYTATDQILTIHLGSYRAVYALGLNPDMDEELRFIDKDIAQDLAVRWATPPMIAIVEHYQALKLAPPPW